MNLKPFLKSNNRTITVIVSNTVQQYNPAEMDNISVRQIWDGFTTRDILELEHGFDHNNDPIMEKIFAQFLKNCVMPDNTYLADFDKEPDAELFQITFFYDDHSISWNKFISNYLDAYHQHLISLWERRGADDDYFDYLPSITDTFRQLCQLFESKNHWISFLHCLVAIEGEDVLEDALYTTEL